MCDCANTLFDIHDMTNKIRAKKGLNYLPFTQLYAHWRTLLNAYEGKQNPYWADRKIGTAYVFSNFKANKIAKKLSTVKYTPQPSLYNSFSKVA